MQVSGNNEETWRTNPETTTMNINVIVTVDNNLFAVVVPVVVRSATEVERRMAARTSVNANCVVMSVDNDLVVVTMNGDL